MTRTTYPQPAFPIAKVMVCVTLAAILCLMATAWLVGTVYGRTPDVVPVACAAAALVWSSLILAVVPVAVLGPAGVLPAVWGYFIGSALRLLICLVSFGLLTKWTGLLPGKPMAIAMVMMYVPLLFVEATLIGRYVWAKDFLPTGEALGPDLAASSMEVAV